MRAILSVWDRQGLVDFARRLADAGVALVSTGGTAAALVGAGLTVQTVEGVTGSPEILGGRVKTLHPAIHGGILARRDVPADLEELRQHGIGAIDLVVCNLYPFQRTIERDDATLADAIEQIDIGGVALLRAAGKNYRHVTVVVDPADYEMVASAIRDGGLGEAARRQLAAKAFQHTAAYDTHVAGFLRGEDAAFPEQLTFSLQKAQDLRYGENPHQRAAFYVQTPAPHRGATLAGAEQLHGKHLSFNNLLDIDAALCAVREFHAPAVSVVKHTNPCGLACADSLAEAYRKAHAGDPVSAFGGAVGLNRELDLETARQIAESHYDDIVAPGYAAEALTLLKKKKNLRIMRVDFRPFDGRTSAVAPTLTLDVKRVSGGFLVQTADHVAEDDLVLKKVSDREPTLDELTDMMFAWRAAKYVKSNAIALAHRLALVGVGAGQMSRVDAVRLAIGKAGDRVVGSVLASDAYFPFPDGVEVAANAGITAIIQPGGSIRDDEIVRIANRHHMAMVFTGYRHFRH